MGKGAVGRVGIGLSDVPGSAVSNENWRDLISRLANDYERVTVTKTVGFEMQKRKTLSKM
jgi:hypothetical protein